MVGIQVGSEQEEKKAKEGSRFRSIVIIHITSNADEELRGRCVQARKISSSIARVLARWKGKDVTKLGNSTRSQSARQGPGVNSVESPVLSRWTISAI